MKSTHKEVIVEGDSVYVIVEANDGRRREHLLKAVEGMVYSTIAGILRGEDLIGLRWGTVLELQAGRAYLLQPTRREIQEYLFKRVGQVIYPKDQGYIVVASSIEPGMTIVEAGVGSGFLTSVLASLLRCRGRIIGYDVRREALETTRFNLSLLGLESCVELRLGDIREGVPEKNIDMLVLDMPDPWEALKSLHPSLKAGAVSVVFVPTYNQVEKIYTSVVAKGYYVLVEAVEILRRPLEVKEGAIRPSTQIIGHTGFIVMLRKILRDKS